MGFKTAGKTEIEELGHKAFLKKIVFISFSAKVVENKKSEEVLAVNPKDL